ncbi:MAG: hypothetical protein LBK76_06870 [Verrucomicrobiales bacterium]|jgi:hypothetical protein|nr:hypothetical protein [Verrucomicrobiales bacterium]
MKRFLAISLLVWLAATALPAQTAVGRLKAAPIDSAPQQIARQIGLFYTNLQNHNIRHAYDELFKDTGRATDRELIDTLVRMTEDTVAKYGNLDSYELTDARAYGSRLLNIVCLTRHQDKFYRWQFVYQSADGDRWRLNNLAVDDWRAFLPAYPVATPPPAEVQIKMEKFFLALQHRAVETAFHDMVSGSPLAGSAGPTAAFIAKTNQALGNYGAMRHYELFDHRPLGRSLRLLTYFTALELQTLRWQFVFTVAQDGQWNLLTIRMDDQIAAGIINSN